MLRIVGCGEWDEWEGEWEEWLSGEDSLDWAEVSEGFDKSWGFSWGGDEDGGVGEDGADLCWSRLDGGETGGGVWTRGEDRTGGEKSPGKCFWELRKWRDEGRR